MSYVSLYVLSCSVTKPPPKKRKPQIATKPKLPMCRAIYDYDATDTDELTLKEGDLLELVKKGRNRSNVKYKQWFSILSP